MPLQQLATNQLSTIAIENITKWLEEPKYAQYKNELEQMIADKKWKQLEDAFFKVIEFGTGGRRGETGIGSNRINRVTIGESAQALCEYASEYDDTAPKKGVVIACDTRLTSQELSHYAAQVCAAAGFKTYIFESFRSTPELSHTVRHLKAAIGIVISASHNPPADNGFKAYWSDGGQLVSPHDKAVMGKVSAIAKINDIDYDQAVKEGKIIIIGHDEDEAYIDAVISQSESDARELKIVFSPLHGAGSTNTLPVLRKAGFHEISVVKDQMVPDGNFPTIENNKANPEEKAANDRAVAQMLAEEADIAITNDPDADRFGVMVRQGAEVLYLSGNQAASLAADYSLSQLKQKGRLTKKHYLAITIVTTDLIGAITNHYGAKIYDNFLVGFKYIGELVRKKETTDEVFIMGAEESFGFMKGDYTRDKDGAAGALCLSEFAAELKILNKTLYDHLLELYIQHGIFVERLDTIQCPGADGFALMQKIMKQLRKTPPPTVGGIKVTAVLDYNTLQRKDLKTGSITKIKSIKGNVVVLEFGDARRRLTIRPSGTEPKLKFYVQWREDAKSSMANLIEDQYEKISDHLEGLSRSLEGLLFKSPG